MNDITTLRRMGFKDDQIASATVNGKPLADVKPTPKASDRWPGFRSKWEQLYSIELDALKAAGDILEWQYEPITFCLTDASLVEGKRVRAVRYTPDFVVWYPGGSMECVEVKGFRRNASINRFKQAKDKFRHIEWSMVTRTKNGWDRMPY
jgi:hypothetical protein